jgi:uncharacterized protein
MEVIYIPHLLKAPGKKQEIVVDTIISNLESLTPVRGKIKIRHGGNFLEVLATAETIITLSCDRCLKQYNYRLSVDTSELIWLEKDISKDLPLEREIQFENLAESLPFNGHFDPQIWLYEQLCLVMPFQHLCSNTCKPPNSEKKQQVQTTETQMEKLIDFRWSALESLKDRLGDDN